MARRSRTDKWFSSQPHSKLPTEIALFLCALAIVVSKSRCDRVSEQRRVVVSASLDAKSQGKARRNTVCSHQLGIASMRAQLFRHTFKTTHATLS
jgi:hypothetical protein